MTRLLIISLATIGSSLYGQQVQSDTLKYFDEQGKQIWPSYCNGRHIIYNKFGHMAYDGIFVEGKFTDGKKFIYKQDTVLFQLDYYNNGRIDKTIK